MTPPVGVVWADRAAKDCKGIDKPARRRILEAIERFAQTGHGDVKALQGEPGAYRLRLGDYRIIFEADVPTNTIIIMKVSHRREAYR